MELILLKSIDCNSSADEAKKFSSLKDPVDKARWGSAEIMEPVSTISKCASTNYSLNRGADCCSSLISGLTHHEKTRRSGDDDSINSIKQDCSANSTSENLDQSLQCRQSMKKNLFGDDDSDSDWEDMNGEFLIDHNTLILTVLNCLYSAFLSRIFTVRHKYFDKILFFPVDVMFWHSFVSLIV